MATIKKKLQRKKYADKFKRKALALADKEGAVKAAEMIGIHPSLIYSWRNNPPPDGPMGSVTREPLIVDDVVQCSQQSNKDVAVPATYNDLNDLRRQIEIKEATNRELKQAIARLEEELAFAKKQHGDDAIRWASAQAALIEDWVKYTVVR